MFSIHIEVNIVVNPSYMDHTFNVLIYSTWLILVLIVMTSIIVPFNPIAAHYNPIMTTSLYVAHIWVYLSMRGHTVSISLTTVVLRDSKFATQ